MNEQQKLDPEALAQACCDALFQRDGASRALGMRIESSAPGAAVVGMTVRADMLNGHRTCHGGFIFALADSAFAFACNSYNEANVALGCTIDYVAPARAGDRLEASASMCERTGRTGVYNVTVRNQNGATIALFRGRSYRVRGTVLETLEHSGEVL